MRLENIVNHLENEFFFRAIVTNPLIGQIVATVHDKDFKSAKKSFIYHAEKFSLIEEIIEESEVKSVLIQELKNCKKKQEKKQIKSEDWNNRDWLIEEMKRRKIPGAALAHRWKTATIQEKLNKVS